MTHLAAPFLSWAGSRAGAGLYEDDRTPSPSGWSVLLLAMALITTLILVAFVVLADRAPRSHRRRGGARRARRHH